MRKRGPALVVDNDPSEYDYSNGKIDSGGGGGVNTAMIVSVVVLFLGFLANAVVLSVFLADHSNRLSELEILPPGTTGPTGETGTTGSDGIDARYTALTEPCNCTSDANGTNACQEGTLWHSLTHDRTDFVCNTDIGQWWSVDTHVAVGESVTGVCNAGNDAFNDISCAVAWGAGIGTDTQVIGRHFLMNMTITGVGYADDDDGNIDCTGGPSSFNIQMWRSPEPATVNFTLYTDIVTNVSSSRYEATGLNIPSEGGLFSTFGILNNCDASISEFILTVYYRHTPYAYELP